MRPAALAATLAAMLLPLVVASASRAVAYGVFGATHARLAMADAPVSSLAPAAPAAPAALTSHPQLAKTLAFAKALDPEKTLETTTTPLLAGALPDDDEVYGALDDDVPPVSMVLRDVIPAEDDAASSSNNLTGSKSSSSESPSVSSKRPESDTVGGWSAAITSRDKAHETRI